MSASGGTKAIIAALLANLGIAVTKFVAYLISGSTSMLAESVHSLADSGNQVLLIIGGRRAKRAATPEHPFGFGRERYVFAFLVSIILFTVIGWIKPENTPETDALVDSLSVDTDEEAVAIRGSAA